MIVIQIFELFGTVLLKDQVTKPLSDIDKKASDTNKSMGLSFGSIANAALKLGGILTLGMGIKDVIEDATGAQKTLALMANTLKTTHDASGMTESGLVSLAESLAKTTTFSDSTTESAEQLLLTFTGVGKKVFPDTIVAAQNMSTVLGTSLTSSVNILGKALSNPTKGVTALARAHVVLTAAQTASIKKMQDSGNLLGAQKALLADVEARYGGAAKAAGQTFGGELTILKNSIMDMAKGLGMTLMPYLTNFTKYINDNMPTIQKVLGGMMAAFVPALQKWIPLLGQIVGSLLPSFGSASNTAKGALQGFSGVLGIITGVLKLMADHMGLVKAGLVIYGAVLIVSTGLQVAHNLATAYTNYLKDAEILKNIVVEGQLWLMITAETVLTAGQWLLNAAMEANPIGLIIIAIVALVAGLVLLFDKNKTFHDFIITMWDDLKNVVGVCVKFCEGLFTELGQLIGDTWNGIQAATKVVLSFIGDFIGDEIKGWEDIFTTAFNIIKSIFSTAWNVISSVIKTIWNVYVSIITTEINVVKTVINDVMNAIKSVFSTVWNAISSVISTVWNDIKSAVTNAINTIKSVISSVMSVIGNAWNSSWNALVNACKDIFGGISSAINNIITTVKNIFNNFISTAGSIGSDIINGIISGIKGALNDMGAAVKSVVDFVVNKFKSLFGIHSPSKVFQSIGGYLISGLIKGLSPKELLAKATSIIGDVTKIFGGGGSGMSPAIVADITQAMAIDGASPQYLPELETIAMHESTGNPSAVNNWDINAIEG